MDHGGIVMQTRETQRSAEFASSAHRRRNLCPPSPRSFRRWVVTPRARAPRAHSLARARPCLYCCRRRRWRGPREEPDERRKEGASEPLTGRLNGAEVRLAGYETRNRKRRDDRDFHRAERSFTSNLNSAGPRERVYVRVYTRIKRLVIAIVVNGERLRGSLYVSATPSPGTATRKHVARGYAALPLYYGELNRVRSSRE